MRQPKIIAGAAALVMLAVSMPSVTTQAAEPCSPVFVDLVDLAAKGPDFDRTPDLILFALSGRISSAADTHAASLVSIPSVEAAQMCAVAIRLKDSPRTDQQVGSSSGAHSALNVADKPGISDLLNIAIEHGAVTKAVSGTHYTLQTTPYLFYSHFGGLDTADSWDRLAALRHIAVSATFAQDDTSTDSSFKNFESAEIKVLLAGGRSARDRAFRDHVASLWKQEQSSLRAANAQSSRWLSSLAPALSKELDAAIDAFVNWRTSIDGAVSRGQVLDKLDELLSPIRARLSKSTIRDAGAVVDAISTEQQVRAELTHVLTEDAKTWTKSGAQLAFSYGFERDATTSDYSRLKGLLEYDNGAPLTLNVNGELDINHRSAAADGTALRSVRSYALEASVTVGRFGNNAFDLTAALKVARDKNAALTTTSLQSKLNFYVTKGLTLPVSLTYASHTDTSTDGQWRVNVGASVDADALIGAARSR